MMRAKTSSLHTHLDAGDRHFVGLVDVQDAVVGIFENFHDLFDDSNAIGGLVTAEMIRIKIFLTKLFQKLCNGQHTVNLCWQSRT